MEELGKPVSDSIKKLDKLINETMEGTAVVDFSDTKTAFAGKSDAELKETARMFRLMGKGWLIPALSKMGMLALRLRFPLTKRIIRETIYKIFVGGRTLLETEETIKRLRDCLLYTSPSPRDATLSRMPSSA